MELSVVAPPVSLLIGEDGVAVLTLASGDEGNRLNRPAIEALVAALKASEADPAVRVLVLRAQGACFCLGLDLDAFLESDAEPDLDGLRLFQEAMLRLHRHRAPVIALVEGRAEGGGLGLVAACDVVLASDPARFMLPEVVFGMIPCMILPFLRRRMSPAAMRALGLSSRALGAAEARSIGLVDEDCGDAPGAAIERQLKRLLRSSPNALREVKQLTERLSGGDIEAELEDCLAHLIKWLEQPEIREGAHLFASGFSPPWFAKRRSGHGF